MNKFLVSTKNQIKQNGLVCSYKSITTGTYDVNTSSVTNTETTYSVTLYPKHITANAYKYPNLVGKDIVMFYLANHSLGFTPKDNDVIIYNSKSYKVVSLQSHFALGEVVLYRLTSVAS